MSRRLLGIGTFTDRIGTMSRQTITFQTYVNYAAKRNLDKNGIEDDEENKQSVVDALKNLSVDPEWVHFHQRDRVISRLPIVSSEVGGVGLDVLEVDQGSVDAVIVGVNLEDIVDDTWVLFDGVTNMEHPIVSAVAAGPAGLDSELTLRFPYLSVDGSNFSALGWKLVKKEYLLPEDFRELLEIEPVDSRFNRIRPTSLAQLMQLATNGPLYARPERYALVSKDNDSRKYITFFPYPNAQPVPAYEIMYLRMPRELVDSAGDFVDLTTVVDWPDAAQGLLNLAIEVEVARKNVDPNALQAAQTAFDRAKGTHLRGTRHNSHGKRIPASLATRGPRDVEVELDLSDDP